MWHIIKDNKVNSFHLYFEKIMFVNNKHTFVFFDDYTYIYIIVEGSVHTCRLINSFHSAFYGDKYITKKDANRVFSKSNICYTDESEYLDWFRQNSFLNLSDEKLYHYYIDAEDYVIEFITNKDIEIKVLEKTENS